jgi:hypothetical protein
LACAPTKVKIYPRETQPARNFPAKSLSLESSRENSVDSKGADWKLYAETSEASYFYDVRSIVYSTKNTVKVSVKLHYTDSGILEMVKDFGERYQGVADEVDTYELRCPEKEFRVLSVTYYSKEGGVLFRVSRDEAKWTSISKESASERLYEAVCK